jgi:hypothetical protein
MPEIVFTPVLTVTHPAHEQALSMTLINRRLSEGALPKLARPSHRYPEQSALPDPDSASTDLTRRWFQQHHEQARNDHRLDQIGRNADQSTQSAMMDRDGVQVQVSRYVLRPDARTVEQLSVTQRRQGPHAGESRFDQTLCFNTDLPTDWPRIARRSLNDPANLEPNGSPKYYLVRAQISASSPAQDSLCKVSAFKTPESQGAFLGQARSDYYWINDKDAGYMDLNAAGARISGDPIRIERSALPQGSWRYEYFNDNPAMPQAMFSLTVYVTDRLGAIKSPGPLTDPLNLGDFSLLGPNQLIGLEIQSDAFLRHEIDLVLEPGFLFTDF